MDWPRIVRVLRQTLGGKQVLLSHILGVSQATISRWESGRQNPGAAHRDTLLELYERHLYHGETLDDVWTPDAGFFFRLDQALRIVYVDPRIEFFAHRPFSEFVGQYPWQAWLPPLGADAFQDACRGVFATGHPAEIEHDGTDYRYHTRLSLDASGQLVEGLSRVIGQNSPQDVWNSLVRHLFYGDAVGMVKADAERIFEANDAFLRIIGYSPQDLAAGGIPWRTITPPEYARHDTLALEELENTGTLTPYEKEYRRSDGSLVWVLVAGMAIQRAPLVIVATIIDITAAKIGRKTTIDAADRCQRLIGTLPDPV